MKHEFITTFWINFQFSLSSHGLAVVRFLNSPPEQCKQLHNEERYSEVQESGV